ncbi:MAG: ECF transporter S component [Vulcanimicrobiota bacterium]
MKKKSLSIKLMIQMALLVSVGTLLMYIQIPYPGAPFLKIDISDVPVLIAGFALGPWVGFVVLILKNLLFAVIKYSPEEIIGLPMNTLATTIMVLVSAYTYKRKKTWGNALLALIAGVLSSILVMIPLNFLILPWFFKTFLPVIKVENSAQLLKLILLIVVPFNLFKGLVNGAITFITYKKVASFIRPTSEVEISELSKKNAEAKS